MRHARSINPKVLPPSAIPNNTVVEALLALFNIAKGHPPTGDNAA